MDAPIKFDRAQFQAGADDVVIANHVTGDLVSTKVYGEYLLPRQQVITSEIGGPLILHVCGNCKDRIEMFAGAGFDAYHFEWQLDAKEAVERVGNCIFFVGNVDNADVLFFRLVQRRIQAGPLCHRLRGQYHRARVHHYIGNST